MKRYTCPRCGNDNLSLIQDNGCDETDPLFTLMCTRPMPASETTAGAEWWAEFGVDQQPFCGYQWEPNQ